MLTLLTMMLMWLLFDAQTTHTHTNNHIVENDWDWNGVPKLDKEMREADHTRRLTKLRKSQRWSWTVSTTNGIDHFYYVFFLMSCIWNLSEWPLIERKEQRKTEKNIYRAGTKIHKLSKRWYKHEHYCMFFF